MVKRGVSPRDIWQALKNGAKYYDPKNDSIVHHFKDVVVATTGKVIKTVYKQIKPAKRWINLFP
jgi:hypothetical protein